jgi:2-polyprenyl-3-methyl-5-hydroxy-6-metoxy-1,4-benzoquinol methylase
MAEEIQYSDGSVEAEILQFLKNTENLGSGASIASEHYGKWPVRYHLSPVRSNLLRPFDFSGLDVLEVGAGMGAISRFLAEKANSLIAIEGTERRLEALQSRLRGLSNFKGVCGNLERVALTEKFDVVCSIGVLEYSELFMTPMPGGGTSFDHFLSIASRMMKDDGVLVLAIENKLGMKYWSGAGEDHSGAMFDGICGYPATKTAKTFSQTELLKLLQSHGFSKIDRYYPFPDYKVATSVISSEFMRAVPEIAANIASHQPFENYGMPRVNLFPEILALRSVANAGLLEHFANSFLFIASKTEASQTRRRLLSSQLKKKEFAWHYSIGRKIPCKTVFVLDKETIKVKKVSLKKVKSAVCQGANGLQFHWSPSSPMEINRKESLRYLLARDAYFGNREGFLDNLSRYFVWAFEKWSSEQWALSGECLDAIIPNVVCRSDGHGFEIFDLEWKFEGNVSKTWFVFRNLFGLFREVPLLSGTQFHKLRELYEYFCMKLSLLADFERDLKLEVSFQEAVTTAQSAEKLTHNLHALFDTPFVSDLPRNPVFEADVKNRLRSLELESAIWNAPAHRLVRRANEQLKKLGPFHKLIKGAVELALTSNKSTS